MIDLTPAAIGPYFLPPGNLPQCIDEANVNVVTCCGQAIPAMVVADSRIQPVEHAEINATVLSKSMGLNTRKNIDESNRTNAGAAQKIEGAAHAETMISIIPAEPLPSLHDTVHGSTVVEPDEKAITELHASELLPVALKTDVSEYHIVFGSKMGPDTVGLLMMSQRAEPRKIVEQAMRMESYVANCIYTRDLTGYTLLADVIARVAALPCAQKPEREIGDFGHHNQATGEAKSVAAVAIGSSRLDSACSVMGAGAGNIPMELFIAIADRMSIEAVVDLFKIVDIAEDLVTPITDFPIRIDRNPLTLGYAGTYSWFLLLAKRAEQRYGVSARNIPIEMRRWKSVGGQDDMIEDMALDLATTSANG